MRFFILITLITFNSFAIDESMVVNSVLNNFPLIEAEMLKAKAVEGDKIEAEGSFDFVLKAKAKIWRQDPYDNDYYDAYLEKQTAFGGMKVKAGHRKGIGDFNYYAQDLETSRAGQAYVGFMTPLLRNLETDEYRTKLEITKIKEVIAKEKIKVKKLISIHKALSLYYKYLFELKKLKINQEILSLAEKRQKFIETKFRAGSESKFKLIENTRILNKRQAEVMKTEAELIQIETELSLYVREKNGTPIKFNRDSEPEDKLEVISAKIFKSIDQNPHLKILTLEKQILNTEKRYNEQSKLPGLNLDVTGYKELSNRARYQDNILQVGVFFDLPLENRKAEGSSVASLYRLKALEKELTFLKDQLDQQFDASFRSGLLAKERWQVAKKEYETAKYLVKGETKKWEMGSSTLFTVNLREQDLADIETRVWYALYEFHQYRLDSGLFTASLVEF